MTGTEPAGSCFVSELAVNVCKMNLTKTQFKYWYEYYVNGLRLVDISIKYDVHITTVCKVLKNARVRIQAAYEKKMTERMKGMIEYG